MSARIDLIDNLAQRIKGFLDPKEGQALYRLALTASRLGPCLEVGSYCGKSTLYLGSACKEHQGILFAVDHHRGSEEQQPGEEYFDPELYDKAAGRVDTWPLFQKTLITAGLEDTVVPLVCTSRVAAKAWSTPLALVFIDGSHAYHHVLQDFLSWSPHLIPGGYLLIHDIFKEPHQGGQAPWQIYQRALASGTYDELPMVKTLGILRRKMK